MFKKFSLIVILSVALGAFLILRPYIFNKFDSPRIEDRLPDADFLGRAYILDLARETSGMLYYNKVPFRDLLSYEFILSQAKLYGLNFQDPVYFFANEDGNWGALVVVSDSSKIHDGIERLGKIIEIEDSLIDDQHIYQYKKQHCYLTYSSNYLFLYKGNDFKRSFDKITKAKRNEISKTWKPFLKQHHFKKEKLVLYSNWDKLKENGIETAMFAHNSDSVSFRLMAYIRNKKPFNISLKSSGLNFKESASVRKMLNIHLNIARLRKRPEDPLYQLLVKLGKKIGFPTHDFINAWEGDLSFRQGGFQLVRESYIESVLDDDFNVTQVKKEKEVKVPGFSLMFSVNKNGGNLIDKLMSKGILTRTDEYYRFLYTPELKLTKQKNYFIFHSGQFVPSVEEHVHNAAIWTQRGTKLEFSLDSLNRKEAFGSIYIPVNKLISKNRFFK
jgi:hypothetical protein